VQPLQLPQLLARPERAIVDDEDRLLDLREGLAHRLVVRVNDALVTAHHSEQRDRLRRRERDVAVGAVLDLAVRAAAVEPQPVGNLVLEDLAEGIRIDWAREPERLRALAGPAAGLAVREIVFRVVAVLLVVGRPCAGEATTPIDITIARGSAGHPATVSFAGLVELAAFVAYPVPVRRRR